MNARVNEKAMWALGAVVVATFVTSCASSDMTSTWTDPSAKGLALSKIAVVCMTEDLGLRLIAEDTTASQIKGAQATPSYQILGDTDLKDSETVKRKLQDAGMNGVLVMRMTGVSERVSGERGTFVDDSDSSGAPVYVPGHLQTDTVVHMITNLYSLDHNKLIWSGVSQTFDPTSAKSLMTNVSKAVAKSLQKDRLVL